MDHLYPTTTNESVLLLDEALVEAADGVEREVQPGAKVPFVMEPDADKPWEYGGPGLSRRIYLYGTVLHDRGKYRMWYFCRMGPHWRFADGNHQIPGLYMPRSDEKPYHYHGATADRYGRAFVDNDRGDLTCYAESDNGIHWRKPELGIFTFDGRADNNIVWDLHGASVFVDRDEPDPRRRYPISFCSARQMASAGTTATISNRSRVAATRAPSTSSTTRAAASSAPIR